jgi:hypothetical protein
MPYVKQPWVNNSTPVDDVHMTHIEDGIGTADANASTALAQSLPQPVVNGQWVKGVGGAAVWSAIAVADLPTGIPAANLSGYPNDASKHLRGNGAWGGGLEVLDDLVVAGAVLANYDTNTRLGGNIPQTYKDLVLAVHGYLDQAAFTEVRLQANGLATGYNWQEAWATGATVTAAEGAFPATSWRAAVWGGANGVAGNFTLQFPNYAAAVSHSYQADYFGSANNAANNLRRGWVGGHLANAAAITRLQLFPATGNFVIGTRFTLYGRG